MSDYYIEEGYKLWRTDDFICYMTDYDAVLNIINGGDRLIHKLYKQVKSLETEKENWKGNYCTANNLANILMNELDCAHQAGYDYSDAYKEYIQELADEFKEKYSDKRKVVTRSWG